MSEPYPYLSADGEVTIGGHVFKVEDTAQATREGRPVFEWTVTAPDGTQWTDTDLNGPACGREPSEREMLGTLLCFIDAALESRDYRLASYTPDVDPDDTNERLFPADMLTSLADAGADELSTERLMIEESLRIVELIEASEFDKAAELQAAVVSDLDTDISLEECRDVLTRYYARSAEPTPRFKD